LFARGFNFGSLRVQLDARGVQLGSLRRQLFLRLVRVRAARIDLRTGRFNFRVRLFELRPGRFEVGAGRVHLRLLTREAVTHFLAGLLDRVELGGALLDLAPTSRKIGLERFDLGLLRGEFRLGSLEFGGAAFDLGSPRIDERKRSTDRPALSMAWPSSSTPAMRRSCTRGCVTSTDPMPVKIVRVG
jgi:hypothetical protein